MKQTVCLALVLCLLLALPCFAALDEATGVYTGDGYSFHAPDGWTETEQMGVAVLVPPDYPANASNMTMAEAGKDYGFSDYTQKDFEDLYSTFFSGVVFHRFDHTTHAGVPAIFIEYSLNMAGVDMVQHQCLYDLPGGTVTLTFTEVDGNTLDDEMDSVLDSLRIDGVDPGESAGNRPSSGSGLAGDYDSRLYRKLTGRMEKAA